MIRPKSSFRSGPWLLLGPGPQSPTARRQPCRPDRLRLNAFALAVLLIGPLGSTSAYAQPITITGDVSPSPAVNPTWNVGGNLIVGDTATGTMIIDAGGTLTSTQGNIGVSAGANGTVTVNGGSWTISGSLTVGNAGAGTLNLNGGMVAAAQVTGGTGAGAVNFNGGTLRLDAATANLFANFTPGSVTLLSGGGTLDTQGFTVATAHGLTGTGGLTKTGAGTLTLGGASTFTGPTQVTGGTLALNHNSALASSTALTVDAGAGVTLSGASRTVAVGSIAGNGTINANTASFQNFSWGADNSDTTFGGVLSGSSLFKNGSGVTTLTGGSSTISALTVNQGGIRIGSVTSFGGGTILTLFGGFLDLDGHYLTIRRLIGNSGTEVRLGSGTLILSDGTSTSTTFAGVISGAGNLIKWSPGTLRLTGNNTFTGTTTVNEGILQIGTNGTSGSLVGNITNYAQVVFRRSDTHTYAGDISGSGSVSHTGSGTVILTGANTYTGGTTITAGTLQLGSGGTSGSVSGNITNNASLVFNRSDAATYAGVISGSGAVVKAGAGTLTFSAAHTYTGATTVDAGTLALGSSGALASSLITLAPGATLDVSAVSGGFNLAAGQTLGGTGTVAGAPTLLSGASLAPGTLSFADGLTLNSGSILNFELGASSDLIVVNHGNLTINSGIILNLADSGGFAAGTYDLINGTGSTINSFDPALFSLGTTIAGYNYALNWSGDRLQLSTTAIPEPSTYAAILGALALGLGWWKRRRAA